MSDTGASQASSPAADHSTEGPTLISLLIKGARVVDGTGAPAFEADIAVDADKISEIGPCIDAPAENVIDAAGCVAAPGFIDIHAHGGLTMLENITADSKAHDGVTTEVLGNCGFSPFPARPKESGFRSAAEFFTAIEKAGSSINRAFLTGLGAVRAFVMGDGADAPSPKDMKAMRLEVARSLEEGTFGVSSGLIYPPGCFASREEIAEVARPAGAVGALYATHMRSEGDDIETALEETEFVARTSGAAPQISHIKLSGRRNWHKIDWLETRLRGMLDDGLDLACDRYTYIASATDLGVVLPNWVHEGPAERRMQRLRDPEIRGRVEREVLTLHPEPEYWDSVLISSMPNGGEQAYVGKNLRQVADERNERPIDALFNLLASQKQKPSVVFFSMCEENLRRVLSWPFVGIGSDARARSHTEPSTEKPHPRAYGTFSRLMGRYVRDEKILPLEEAVRRVTSMPAGRLGLSRRGVLREGAFADVTIFDPETVTDRGTFTEPCRTPPGILYVLVNGRPVIENGKHTGALPGRMLRRGQ